MPPYTTLFIHAFILYSIHPCLHTLLYSSMPPYEEGNMTDEEVGESVLIEMDGYV
jgi:hypothetical protein